MLWVTVKFNYVIHLLYTIYLCFQVVKFVVASLNSRCSPTKGRSVLVAGMECSPSNHDLLITGLGPACEKNYNTLHRLIIKQLKDTIFVKSHYDRARESRYPFTNLTPHQVIVKLPCSESGCDRGRERNTEKAPSSSEQQQCHVLVVSACPVLSLCTDKLFMVRCRESEEFKVYQMGHDTICDVPEHEIRELHNNIAREQSTTEKRTS